MIKKRFYRIQKTMRNRVEWRSTHAKLFVDIILHLLFWIVSCCFFLFFFVDKRVNNYTDAAIRFSLTIVAVYVCYSIFYKMLYKKGLFLLFWYFMAIIVVVFSSLEFALIHAELLYSVDKFEYEFINDYLTGVYWGITLRYAFFILLFALLRFHQEAKRTIRLDKKVYANELLSCLSSRVLPHYLVGVINNLQALAITSSDKLPELLDKLNMLLHYIMTKTVREKVILKEEIDFYCNYINLELLRYPSVIDFTFEKKKLKEETEIAPLLFENIINNAFKYTCHDGTGYVKITVIQNDENILTFECENNVSPDVPHISYGEGLDNLLDRLNLLYHNCYDFRFENQNGIYKVILKLSL